jgi:hypothetical protein
MFECRKARSVCLAVGFRVPFAISLEKSELAFRKLALEFDLF